MTQTHNSLTNCTPANARQRKCAGLFLSRRSLTLSACHRALRSLCSLHLPQLTMVDAMQSGALHLRWFRSRLPSHMINISHKPAYNATDGALVERRRSSPSSWPSAIHHGAGAKPERSTSRSGARRSAARAPELTAAAYSPSRVGAPLRAILADGDKLLRAQARPRKGRSRARVDEGAHVPAVRRAVMRSWGGREGREVRAMW
jgi:hypothetical protein